MKLAELVDVSINSIKSWEGDKKTLSGDKVPALCEALNITPNQLYQWEEVHEESSDVVAELLGNLGKLTPELKESFMMQIRGMNQVVCGIVGN